MTNAALIRKPFWLVCLSLAACAGGGGEATAPLAPMPVPARVSTGYNAPELTAETVRPVPAERRVERTPTNETGEAGAIPWSVIAATATAEAEEETRAEEEFRDEARVPSPPVGLAVQAAHRGMTPLPDLDAIIVTDSRRASGAKRAGDGPMAGDRREEQAAARRREEDAALSEAELKLAALTGAATPAAYVLAPAAGRSPAQAPGRSPKSPAPQKAASLAESGRYAIHLASYKDAGNVLPGWDVLRAQHQELLDALSPLTTPIRIEGKGDFIRLIAGPFVSGDEAGAACDVMRSGGRYCAVVPFEGTPL